MTLELLHCVSAVYGDFRTAVPLSVSTTPADQRLLLCHDAGIRAPPQTTNHDPCVPLSHLYSASPMR